MPATSAGSVPFAGTPADEPRDARRRRQLIEATIASIAADGLSGTTVAKVARRAGLSAGIVNFYFQTKDALLLASLEAVDREFAARQRQAIEQAGDDPVRQLEAMIDVDFDPAVCDPDRVAVWDAFWGEARAREDYMRVCGRREKKEGRRVVELFERIARAGGYQQLDPRALGRAFYHLLMSLPEEMLESGAPFDFEGAKATCRGFLASVFPAEFAPPSGRTARAPTPSPPAAPALREEPGLEPPDVLPAWVYRDPEFHELEKREIFRRQWLLVGHAGELPDPGDYVTLDAADERALVVRGEDGALRAFHNVCRHRASRVVRGETGSCADGIVCPYHGWRYDLAGRLRSVPAAQTFRGLDEARLGLPDLELETWHGFLFVRFGGDGPGVAALLQPVEAEARAYRLSELRILGRRWSRDGHFDWKVFAENDAERYHVPQSQPGLQRLFGASDGEVVESADLSHSWRVLRERESPAWSERLYQRLLPPVEHLPEARCRAWVHLRLFPALVFVLAPEQVTAYQALPLGPGRCRIQGLSLAQSDGRREMRAARYLGRRILRGVLERDLEICRFVDAGVRSSISASGVLSELEHGVRRFRERIRERIPVAGCPAPPPRGCVTETNERMRVGG
jgi:phenylpropionate dioxygenase-like ring-hydroxylating dioxygenase large terminal subunit/AcrR family transcriptional regulator